MGEKNFNAFGPGFKVDDAKCIACGQCASDCIAGIIHMENGRPVIPADEEAECIGCQHCLAICPAGAVSVMGRRPEDSISLKGFAADYQALKTLTHARRSFRHFQDEPVDAAVLQELLADMAYAPTGVNACQRRVAVINDPASFGKFREEAYAAIHKAEAEKRVPESLDWVVAMAYNWDKKKEDGVFRGATGLMVVTAPKDAPCPAPDCIIALSYFDLLAQARGVGTVWAGLVYWLLALIAPEMRGRLGIPADHEIGYAMLFGKPSVTFARTVQRQPENVTMITL